MRVLILLLVAACAVLSVKAGGDKQKLQQQSSQGQPQGPLHDQQEGSPQEPPQGSPEDQEESLQQEPSEGKFQEPQKGPFQGPQEGPFQGPFQGPPQGPQKGDHKGQRPGPPGPHPGPQWPPQPPPIFNNFTTPQLNDIVNRMLREAGGFREKFGNKRMNGHWVIDHFRAMFVNYNATLKSVEENFASCVTDDMKALPEKAITEILSCLPTPTDLETKKTEAKAAFEALLETLKAADEDISALTDETQKQIKVAQIEWSDVYQFYVDKADKMLKGLETTQSCLSNERSAIHTEVTKYLEELSTCAK